MLRNDAAYADKAARVSALAKDITEVLVTAPLPPVTPKGLFVAYHAACSLQHGQKVTEAPKHLLAEAGFTVAMANKTAKIAWAGLKRGEVSRPPVMA